MMQTARLNVRLSGAARVGARAVPVQLARPSRSGLVCRAAATTAWEAWSPFMERRGPEPTDPEQDKKYSAIGSIIATAAKTYQPKFTSVLQPGVDVRVHHVDKIQIKQLPKDLHDKLETIGAATLEGALNLSELDYLNASFTTTDIDGALSITGTILEKGSDRSAVLAFVATETERLASWSRLDGLILHWACTSSPGGPWAMPPEGWTSSPAKSRDAGGAIQSQFEKQSLGDNSNTYVLVMQFPLRGILRSGGLVFVLKGTANQTDRWLKDASTNKDFYLDLQTLPVTKA